MLEKTVTTTVEMKFGTHVVYLYSPRRQMHLVDYVIEHRVQLMYHRTNTMLKYCLWQPKPRADKCETTQHVRDNTPE